MNYWVSVVLRSAQFSLGFQSLEEQIFISQFYTSGGGLPFPDLSFHAVSEHLEASSNMAELLGSTASQEGATLSRGVWTWTVEGKKLILY
jgi:hypothetical protein